MLGVLCASLFQISGQKVIYHILKIQQLKTLSTNCVSCDGSSHLSNTEYLVPLVRKQRTYMPFRICSNRFLVFYDDTDISLNWFCQYNHHLFVLHSQAMKKFMEGNAIETLDPNLSVTPATNLALEKILELSLQCLAPTRQQRPSMRRCAEILWNIRKDYWEMLSSDPISKSSHHGRKSSTTLEKI